MTLVLPAPLGPRSPSTSPRPTVKETPSTAVRRPYRLRSPEHHTAGDGGRPPSSCSAACNPVPSTVSAAPPPRRGPRPARATRPRPRPRPPPPPRPPPTPPPPQPPRRVGPPPAGRPRRDGGGACPRRRPPHAPRPNSGGGVARP